MTPSRHPRKQRLEEGIAELGIHVASSATDQLLAFLDLLVRWNRRIRLVGDAERDDAVDVIILDSLGVLLAVPDAARTLVDVGSGAGLPGLVLAIAHPELHVTTIEPIHKKIAFQRTAVRELGLSNVEPHAIRVEALGEDATFDVAVSRATFALDEWLDRGRRYVNEAGVVVGLANRAADIPATARTVHYRLAGRDRYLAVRPASR